MGASYIPSQASEIASTAVGTVAATNVQSAIEELDTEKAPLASPVFTGTVGLPPSTGALSATDGNSRWDSTRKQLVVYDTQREKGVTAVGWIPYAYGGHGNPVTPFSTAATLAANGGSFAIPVVLSAPMLLQSVSIYNTDTTTARSWNWHLFVQDLNNGNAGENTLSRVASGTADDAFTAAAASLRTIAAASAPVFLSPGLYWVVVQNTHATSTLGYGYSGGGNLATTSIPSFKTKTLTVPVGATLDFVAATWSAQGGIAGVRLNGRVFGQTTPY